MHADVNELQPDLSLVLPAPFTLIQILAFVSQQEKLARKRKGDMHHHFRPALGAINNPTGNDGVAGGWHDETGSDIDLFRGLDLSMYLFAISVNHPPEAMLRRRIFLLRKLFLNLRRL